MYVSLLNRQNDNMKTRHRSKRGIVHSSQDQTKAKKKGERKKPRNKDNDIEPSSDTEQEVKEEPKKKRLDDLEETP